MPNLHSHAFQRAMAGLTEQTGTEDGAGDDSFWTWRKLMYGFVGRLRPEQVEAIAGQLYVEMLKSGYTAVAEFHYLHHDPDGAPYGDLAEMSERVIAAAKATGIGLTMLPVLYGAGGFGGKPADRRPAPLPQRSRALPGADRHPPQAPWRRSPDPHRHRAAFAARRHAGDAERGGRRASRPGSDGADPYPYRRADEGGGGLPRLVAASGRWNGCSPISPSTRTGAWSMRPI